MTIYYRLELLDVEWWLSHHEQFSTPEAASAFREKVIADPDDGAYYLIVEQGCPTRIVEVTERVVQEFPGLVENDQ